MLGGGGEGMAGLYIGDDLRSGNSNPCDTFNNEVLSHDQFFKVVHIECWELIP
jgi:hypothetical protein